MLLTMVLYRSFTEICKDIKDINDTFINESLISESEVMVVWEKLPETI